MTKSSIALVENTKAVKVGADAEFEFVRRTATIMSASVPVTI